MALLWDLADLAQQQADLVQQLAVLVSGPNPLGAGRPAEGEAWSTGGM